MGTDAPAPRQLLIVDGNTDMAESVQLLLEALGYVVHVAATAAAALLLLEAHPIELAFVAIALPDVDGYTLAQRLRAAGRPRVLIAFTGYGSLQDRHKALAAGFDDHLLKPATGEQIHAVLVQHLGDASR